MTKQDPPDSASGDVNLQRDRFVAFSFAATDFVFEIDAKGLITFASGAARELTGRVSSDLIGTPWLELIDQGDRPKLARIVKELGGAGRTGAVPVRLLGRTDSAIQVVFRACRLPHRNEFAYCTLSASNVLVALGGPSKHRDPNSGLLDRKGFADLAQDSLDLAAAQGEPVELTFIDLNCDALNQGLLDSERQDQFMADLGVALRARALGGEMAGSLADGKFGVIHDSSVDGGEIEHEVLSLARSFDLDDEALAMERGTMALETLDLSQEEAAQALVYTINQFAASPSSDGTLRSLCDGFRERANETKAKIGWFKSVVANARFDFCLQPIADLASGKTKHFEYLIRFEKGKSPYPWITFAEGIGIIQDLDMAVVAHAIDFLRRNASNRDLAIAVNLSGRSLSNTAFVDSLLSFLITHAAYSKRLLIEITESSQISDLRQANKAILALRGTGFSVGLDDFGAGSASFQYLRALDVDFVKFDGAYVNNVMEFDRERLMLKAMAGLCRDLGIRTIGEMIEREEQARLLLSLGIELGQGYWIGKPDSPDRYGIGGRRVEPTKSRPAAFAHSPYDPFTGAAIAPRRG